MKPEISPRRMETARTHIILREVFTSLLPNKIEVFQTSETVNSAEKEVLEDLEEYVQLAKIESAQKFNDILKKASIESLTDIKYTVKWCFDLLFNDGIDYGEIIVFIIFCYHLINHLQGSKLKNTTRRVYKLCVKRILTDVESWIQSDGEKWDVFRLSAR